MKSPNQNKFFIINLIIVLVFSSAYIETEDELENVFSVHDQSLLSVLYMQTSAEFIANNLQVYENAAKAIDLALSDKSWSAAIEQNGDFSKKLPAIIIDVDETVLDNSPYQARAIKDNFGYPNGWIEWGLEESASSVAGAKKFLDYAKSRDVKIFYVTNRVPELREATINNFKKVNIPFEVYAFSSEYQIERYTKTTGDKTFTYKSGSKTITKKLAEAHLHYTTSATTHKFVRPYVGR